MVRYLGQKKVQTWRRKGWGVRTDCKLSDIPNTMDGEAYAFYVEDLAAAARGVLGEGAPVHLYHDGVRWHDSPPPADRMASVGVVSLGKPPARSPDCNVIENLFGWAETELDKAWVAERPKNWQDTVSRFKTLCRDADAAGHIKEVFDSMPERPRALVDGEGGPTRY